IRAERADDDLRVEQAEAGRRLRHLFELTTEASAAKEIRIFGLAGELIGRRRTLFDELERARVRRAVRSTALTSLGWGIFGAGYLGGVALALDLAVTGRATVGALVLVLALGGQLNQQLSEITGNLRWLIHTHRAVQRLFWLMDHATAARTRLEPASPLP